LASSQEQLHELLYVAFVLRDARQHRGRVLGVVEGDEHLDVLFLGRFDPCARAVERVAVHDRVVGGDIAGDPRVQLLPVRIGEHLRFLVADARNHRRGGVRARARVRARGGGGQRRQR
jgi:hypothetical protein